MRTTILALVPAFTVGIASSASVQSAQIPGPSNPTPADPVATDGSSLLGGAFEGRAARHGDYLATFDRGGRSTGDVVDTWGRAFYVK